MQVDGYDTYNAVCADGTVVRLGCLAHSLAGSFMLH